MNDKVVGKFVSQILAVEAAFMLPALIISAACQNLNAVIGFIVSIVIILGIASLLYVLCRKANKRFFAKEGLVSVGIGWIVLSILGCLPFFISREIPSFVDALFETVSGFTTTGASILTDVEAMSKGMLYWRSFSHWLGGMGVLVFLLAIAPADGKSNRFTMHLLRAESPGPTVGKLAPRMRDTALILYLMYIGLTGLNFIFLIIGKMPVFDAVCTAFGTAGTGGFGIKGDSMAGYSPYIQNVCTIFMLLFGVNFSCYYLVLLRRFKSIIKDSELRTYVVLILSSVALITINISGMFSSVGQALHHAAFTVSSIITTTGFATEDFNLWPNFSKTIILMLMFVGACGGSTGGGLKCGRLLIILKSVKRNIRKTLNPRKVEVIRMGGNVVKEEVVSAVNSYFVAYIVIVFLSFIFISVDGYSILTNFSSVASCFNNIGPGLDMVGPASNYSMFSDWSKLVLIGDMLAGRLEIFPILILLSKTTWSRKR